MEWFIPWALDSPNCLFPFKLNERPPYTRADPLFLVSFLFLSDWCCVWFVRKDAANYRILLLLLIICSLFRAFFVYAVACASIQCKKVANVEIILFLDWKAYSERVANLRITENCEVKSNHYSTNPCISSRLIRLKQSSASFQLEINDIIVGPKEKSNYETRYYLQIFPCQSHLSKSILLQWSTV